MRIDYMQTSLLRRVSLLLLLILCLSPFAWAVPDADADEKVNDLAGELSANEERDLARRIAQMSDAYAQDFVIVITDDNEGLGHVAYADDFYDYNGYGVGPNNDGLLFLIDLDDRFVYISTHGTALNVYFNDAAIDAVIDETYPFVADGDFYGACQAFLDAAAKHIEWVDKNPQATYSSPRSYIQVPTDPISNLVYRMEIANEDTLFIALIVGVFAALFTGIIVFMMHRSSLPGAPIASVYISGAFNVTKSVDQFLHTNTTRTEIPKNDSKSGGGTSSHTSSSGRSHGGGGRSF